MSDFPLTPEQSEERNRLFQKDRSEIASLSATLNVMDDDHVKQLSRHLNVSEECASQVQYLRTRQRHTPELEAQLIELHKAGTPPNIFEFGVTAETQATLLDAAEKEMAQRGQTKSFVHVDEAAFFAPGSSESKES